jgi:hypothetical protein
MKIIYTNNYQRTRRKTYNISTKKCEMKNIAWIKSVQDNHKCKVKWSNEREKVTWIIKLVSHLIMTTTRLKIIIFLSYYFNLIWSNLLMHLYISYWFINIFIKLFM